MKHLIKNIMSSLVPTSLITKNYNPVLLYHSLGSSSKFNDNIDHVNLETLNTQLESIQKYWKFVSIDEYVNTKNKKNLASLTIDDGYKNVIDESLEVFKNLNIPITIFINSSTFDGKVFWRDKVRFLIKKNIVQQYISKSHLFGKNHIDEFYSISKSQKFNSIKVEKDIDQFLLEQNIKLTDGHKLCFDSRKYLIKDALVSYGNHTANHYMLSSLSKQEQYEEILKCKNFIDKLDINKSEVFGIPFGGLDSFNKDTLINLEDLNYKKILKSTNDLDNIIISDQINRFMPKTFKIENTLKKLYLKKIIKG